MAFIRLDFSAKNLSYPPICTLGSFAISDGEGGFEVVTPRLVNMSKKTVDIIVTERTAMLPVSVPITFICDLPEQN